FLNKMIDQIKIRLDRRFSFNLVRNNDDFRTRLTADIVGQSRVVEIVDKDQRDLVRLDLLCDLTHMLRTGRYSWPFFNRSDELHPESAREIRPYFMELVDLHTIQRRRSFEPSARLC